MWKREKKLLVPLRERERVCESLFIYKKNKVYTSLSIYFILFVCRYEGLDRVIKSRLQLRPNSFRFVATKVAVDGFIFGPLDLLAFFTYMGFSTGKSVPQIKEDVKRDFLPALILEGGIWPIVQVANFRYIPVRYQLLYVNLFCLLDSCFLSWIEQQQDAPWKQWLKSFLPLKEQKGQGG
jgi:protein Mpv17